MGLWGQKIEADLSNEETIMQNIEQFLKIVRPYRWSIEDMQAMIKSTYIKYSMSLNQKDDILKTLREQHIRQDNNTVDSEGGKKVYFVGSFDVGFKYLVNSEYDIVQSARNFESCCLIYRNNFIIEIFKNSRGKYIIARVISACGKELLDITKLSNYSIDDYSVEIKQIKDNHNKTYLIVNLGDIDREYSNINSKTIIYRYDESKQSLSEVYRLGTNTTSVAKVAKFIGDNRVENKEVVLSAYQTNAASIYQIIDNDDIAESLLRKVEYERDDWIDIRYNTWDNNDGSELRKAIIDNLAVTVIKIFDIDTFMEYTYIDMDEAFMECIQVVEYDEIGKRKKIIDRNIKNRQEFRKLRLCNYGETVDEKSSKGSLYKVIKYDATYGVRKLSLFNETWAYPINIFADDGKQRSLIESLNIEMPEAFK